MLLCLVHYSSPRCLLNFKPGECAKILLLRDTIVAGPIPTIQELAAQDARDDDAESAFEEDEAPSAGMVQCHQLSQLR